MSISVIEPVSSAIDRTRRALFEPFAIGKWFVLGFCAFLANLLEGGSSGNGGSWREERRSGEPLELPDEFSGVLAAAWEWLVENYFWGILIALGVVVLIAVVVALMWLKGRGKFMFLDGVVLNRGAVVEPWRRFRRLGNSLFWFYVLIESVWGAFIVGVTLLILSIVWPDIVAGEFGARAMAGLIVGLVIFLPCALIAGLIGLFLDNLVIPVMYLRNVGVWPAWGVFGREILAAQVGPVVLFCLMRILIRIAIVVLSVLVCCCTCCVAIIPYIGSVILLPLSVFDRCYSLYFLEQFGPPWRFFVDEAPPAPAALVTSGGTI